MRRLWLGVLACLLAVAALVGSNIGSVPSPAPAGATVCFTNCIGDLNIEITPQAEADIMFVAYVTQSTNQAAHYFCDSRFVSSAWGDCMFTLEDSSYSYPILQFLAYYDQLTVFQWNLNTGAYNGVWYESAGGQFV